MILLCSALLASGPQLGASAGRAQDPDPAERAAVLRAMVILKIAPYLAPEQKPAEPPHKDGEPPRAPASYRIGLVGRDDVTAAAPRHLPGKRVGAAVVTTVEVKERDATAKGGETPRPYDLLYVAADTPREVVARIVAAHRGDPVPIVCEQRGFAADGGGVQLFVQENTLRFEINPEALKRQGVRASPQLLKLSREGPR